jgi:hypothetical protein
MRGFVLVLAAAGMVAAFAGPHIAVAFETLSMVADTVATVTGR